MLWHHYTIVLYSFLLFFFQKVDVLVSRGVADVADPRQFGHIELSSLVGGIVAKEARRDIIGGHLRSADFLPFAFAFSMPERTLARIIDSSNWLNTPDIWRKASLMGSA